VDGLWATKSEGVGLSVRAISFQDFQPMWSWSTNVTDRQTDGQTEWQTDRYAISIPRYALVHRTVKIISVAFHSTRTSPTDGTDSHGTQGCMDGRLDTVA